jgi:hypothetical protein
MSLNKPRLIFGEVQVRKGTGPIDLSVIVLFRRGAVETVFAIRYMYRHQWDKVANLLALTTNATRWVDFFSGSKSSVPLTRNSVPDGHRSWVQTQSAPLLSARPSH